MSASHCLSSLWPGFNPRPWWSISREFSLADHILPTRPEPARQKVAQSPLNGTTCTTCGNQEERPKFNHGQTMADCKKYLTMDDALEHLMATVSVALLTLTICAGLSPDALHEATSLESLWNCISVYIGRKRPQIYVIGAQVQRATIKNFLQSGHVMN